MIKKYHQLFKSSENNKLIKDMNDLGWILMKKFDKGSEIYGEYEIRKIYEFAIKGSLNIVEYQINFDSNQFDKGRLVSHGNIFISHGNIQKLPKIWKEHTGDLFIERLSNIESYPHICNFLEIKDSKKVNFLNLPNEIYDLRIVNTNYMENLESKEITLLEFIDCDNLKIEILPSSIKSLRFLGCENLKYLPIMPKKLDKFELFNLPNLTNLGNAPNFVKTLTLYNINLPEWYLDIYTKLVKKGKWSDIIHKNLLREKIKSNPSILNEIQIPKFFTDLRNEFKHLIKSDEYGLF